MKKQVTAILVFVIALTSCAHKDEAPIRQNAKSYAEAYNERNAAKLASFWAEDAVYVNPRTGEKIKGRANIEKEFSQVFEKMGEGRLKLDVLTVAFEGPDKAIEEGTATIQTSGEPDHVTFYRAVSVKNNGDWKLVEVSESETDTPLSNYEHLRDLEWLIGNWVESDADSTLELSGKWDTFKNFITQKFMVKLDSKVEFEGFQIIGWDPRKEEIRSWLFDSDGGFGEGIWRFEEDKWIVESVQTLPDGRLGTSINIYSNIGKDRYTWESTGREVGGTILPNIEPVTIKRK